ncbi:CopD family protein [soil metagenome]
MTQLAGFLDVLLRGISLIGFAIAVGGMAYMHWALRPLEALSPLKARVLRRSLWFVVGGSLVLALSRSLLLFVLHPWALADAAGHWPVAAFLNTEHARSVLSSVLLALGLAGAAARLLTQPSKRALWAVAGAISIALLIDSAWLTHGVSRLEGRAQLMAVTVLHQTGGLMWAGGIVHLLVFWRLWKRGPEDRALAPAVFSRFSMLAIVSMIMVLGPGLFIAWRYIGDWGGLTGTGYGVMVLTKAMLLGAGLILGAMNFFLVRAWARQREAVTTPLRVRAFVEAEAGLGVTLLLAAASLTSLPPSIDIVADRASPEEVIERFVPKMPRLSSPPVADLLAVAAPIDDTLAARQPEEYAWSEFNHNMSGLFVFAMGLLALLERTGKAPWARHWPLLFLGLAAFMFLRNDPRAWPLGPAGFWESILLPDVLQHRIAVLVVIGLAVFEWMVRTGQLQSRWRLVFPLLCAFGGTILLTHSHAMFNLKAEFLTEVTHAPLGLFAVISGWGRWLELRLPREDQGLPGWIWSTAFVMIGLTLLFYRET